MHKPSALRIRQFGKDALSSLTATRQVNYLRCYLADLGATSVLEEPKYFDRDYLAEFSAFYSVSSKGYPNLCQRLHFFSTPEITRDLLRRAAGGSSWALQKMQESYLGFVIIRPISASPLGRTVVRWYPEQFPNTPRMTSPSRDYHCHVAGITLRVHGLAWQQQDTGVGACATIGLWSMLHSSAFDDHHAIPTTAEITKAAHRTASLGARVFPSSGLNIYQLSEAIKEHKLAPVVLNGEYPSPNEGFGKERFASSCGSFIRSGYPILIIGELVGNGLHAICATGFRECVPSPLNPGDISIQDSSVEFLYVHDDNLGPNVRFKIVDNGLGVPVSLQSESPPPRTQLPVNPSPTQGYPAFKPMQLVVALHEDLRTSPDVLHKAGLIKANMVCKAINILLASLGIAQVGVTLSCRFMKLSDYLESELGRVFAKNSKLLARARLGLSEKVPPMSLHIGVVRIALDDATPLLDIIYDTTDSDRNHPVFAHLAYNPSVAGLVKHLSSGPEVAFGVQVPAF